MLPWELSDLVVTSQAWILILVLTPLLADLRQLPLPECGRQRWCPQPLFSPSLGTWLPNWRLSFPASLANRYRQVTILTCRQDRYRLLLPFLLPRNFLVQGFLSSHKLQYGYDYADKNNTLRDAGKKGGRKLGP